MRHQYIVQHNIKPKDIVEKELVSSNDVIIGKEEAYIGYSFKKILNLFGTEYSGHELNMVPVFPNILFIQISYVLINFNKYI
ncbi:hypothetical protein Lalb_Chr16g0390241 [Lupinus albus]|uniref:Uncharacterized protein n=1 Tax=Lupinus albus TaxID=3870 RepID=A0A6A4P812_LUPAL|nr:hypothetical protein Lalb_Chr16g0390241 [Lupinus albus]